MTSDRFVLTQAVHEAAKGRQTEVLEALESTWVNAALGERHWRWRFEVVE